MLRAGGRGLASSGGQRARRALVAMQLAVTLVLVTGAGLMVRTMIGLSHVSPGFDADQLLTFHASFVGPAYAEDERVEALTNEMLDRIRKVPGVRAVAVSSQFPLGGNMDQWGLHIEGRSVAPDEVPNVERYGVTPDYLRVMRIPLVAGRFFTPQDRPDGEPVVVISEATARRLWPGEQPLGARVKIGAPTGPVWRRVVGIAGDVRHYDLDSAPPMAVYTPNSQLTDSYVVFTVKTASPPEQIVPSLRDAVWQVARDVPVYKISEAEALVSQATASRRFATALLSIFAGIAVLLAGVGLYGVTAFAIAERTKEVGVRVAFGATRRDVVRLVARAAVGPLAAGLAAGLVASTIATRGLQALLFSVAPVDAITYVAASALLVGAAALAHVAPLRRALSVDPAIALRQE
jgi:putative ABC transport system permease protein